MVASKHEILSKAEALSEKAYGLFLGYKFECVKSCLIQREFLGGRERRRHGRKDEFFSFESRMMVLVCVCVFFKSHLREVVVGNL